MAYTAMIAAVAGSPKTRLLAAISATDTDVYLESIDDIGAAPGRLTLFDGIDIETIDFPTDPVNRVLSGVTRAVEGTARIWPKGSFIARRYTGKDHNDIIGNIADHQTRIGALEAASGSNLTQVTHAGGATRQLVANSVVWVGADGLVTLTLPATAGCNVGSIIWIFQENAEAGAYWKIAQNASQVVSIDGTLTVQGTSGYIQSQAYADWIALIYAGYGTWRVFGYGKTLTVNTAGGAVTVPGDIGGADGKTVLNGSGAPGAGTGAIGDFYIDTTAHALYGPKSAGGWGSATSLIGPQGEAGGGGSATWTAIAGASFTATPASTSTITTTSDLTANVKPGIPLKYTIGGVVYYGICTASTASLITIAGAPLGGDITALYYGDAARVEQVPIAVPGLYEDATNTALIAADLDFTLPWDKGAAYLVRIRAKTAVADSGGDGKVNARIAGADVCSTSGGLTLNDTAWKSTVVNLTTANYDIQFGEEIEVNVTKGTGGLARGLSVMLTFVLP